MEKSEVIERKDPQFPAEVKNQSSVQQEIEKLIPLAGTIELSPEQRKILFAPVNPEDVEIRPDGLVYLPWMEYVTRLRDAFGVSWTLLPKGPPVMKGDLLLWGFYLIIQGKPAGFAVGEQQYHPTNRTMTYGDALEGAKSNALMRLCKGLGISLELWKPSFIREWKAKYAEVYEEKGKERWRKKGTSGEIIYEFTETEQPSDKQPTESELLCSQLHDEMMSFTTIDQLKEFWEGKYRKESKKLTPEHKQFLTELKDRLKTELP